MFISCFPNHTNGKSVFDLLDSEFSAKISYPNSYLDFIKEYSIREMNIEYNFALYIIWLHSQHIHYGNYAYFDIQNLISDIDEDIETDLSNNKIIDFDKFKSIRNNYIKKLMLLK